MLKFHQALLLLVQTTIGEGVILVPYALALAGIPSGIAFLILFMIMTYYSVHLLIILKEKTLLQ